MLMTVQLHVSFNKRYRRAEQLFDNTPVWFRDLASKGQTQWINDTSIRLQTLPEADRFNKNSSQI